MKLAPHDNVVGLKDATGDLTRLEETLSELTKLKVNNFILYSGDDPSATKFMLKGGSGTISVTANVVPSLIAEICDQALSGDNKIATKLDLELEELNKILFIESNPIPVKWILNRLGRIPGGLRLPLVELDNKFHEKTELILKELSLLN
jgi:4-hydroxy-tetrahydrodipicolinate synthase